MRGLGRLRFALVIAFVAACGAARPPFPPTYVVPLPANTWGDFALEVYDGSGIVTGGRAIDPAPTNWDITAEARPAAREIDVSWLGGACAHRPILNVRGAASDLKLEIVPSPTEFSLTPVGCPAVGIVFGVTLTLAEPVEQAAITLTETR